MQNKKGEGMAVSTIILIVLGLFILVILALGFMFGWKTLLFWVKPESNVDQISAACEVACITQSSYSFCSLERKIIVGNEEIIGTCNQFSDPNNEEYKKYNIKQCSGLCQS